MGELWAINVQMENLVLYLYSGLEAVMKEGPNNIWKMCMFVSMTLQHILVRLRVVLPLEHFMGSVFVYISFHSFSLVILRNNSVCSTMKGCNLHVL